MPIPIRAVNPSCDSAYHILTTDDGTRTLVEVASDDSFHSGCGALAETRQVYLLNSGVFERLAAKLPTSVLEVGVGTAMALLCTLSVAIENDAPLHYVGLERNWITSELLSQLAPQSWIENPSIIERYLQWRSRLPKHVPVGRYVWEFDVKRQVTIVVGDAVQWQPTHGESFDAIYFDPFAPASVPELWSAPMLRKMRAVMNEDGRLVTYCVNRQVRDNFSEAGFDVTRRPGPVGGKREVLVAYAQTHQSQSVQ